jgi:hypothetical protein
MPGQTTIYDVGGLPKGIEGMKADTSIHVAESLVNSEASASLRFGTMVKKGTNDGDAKVLSASNDVLMGIVMHSDSYAPQFGGFTGGLSATGLAPKEPASVMTRGKIFVFVEEDVVQGDRAYVRYAAGAGGSVMGRFRKSSVANETIDVTKKCRFATSATAGNLAILEVDMMNA